MTAFKILLILEIQLQAVFKSKVLILQKKPSVVDTLCYLIDCLSARGEAGFNYFKYTLGGWFPAKCSIL